MVTRPRSREMEKEKFLIILDKIIYEENKKGVVVGS